MVKSDILTAAKANRFYWLGRYEERVYMTLHLMGKCCDKIIDGQPEDYSELWNRLDMQGMYATREEFETGMLYDENNPCSLLSAQKSAMDNAIMLREDLLSETLSYIEMSLNLLRRCKAENVRNLSSLQPVIDWTLAFWGSAELRVENHMALNLIQIGRNVENLDMKLRFGYSFRKVIFAFETLMRYCSGSPGMVDDHIVANINRLLTPEQFDLNNTEYKYELIKFVNQVARV